MFKNILVFLYNKKIFRRIIPSFLRRFYFFFSNKIFLQIEIFPELFNDINVF